MKDILLEKNIAWANQTENYKIYEYCSKLSEADEKVYNQVNYMGSSINQYLTKKQKLI